MAHPAEKLTAKDRINAVLLFKDETYTVKTEAEAEDNRGALCLMAYTFSNKKSDSDDAKAFFSHVGERFGKIESRALSLYCVGKGLDIYIKQTEVTKDGIVVSVRKFGSSVADDVEYPDTCYLLIVPQLRTADNHWDNVYGCSR